MYIDIIAAIKKRLEVEIWAYCLMPNHVHLIVVPEQRNDLAQLFGRAHRKYALEVNTRDGWQGHLWQERYHSFVMDEEHLLAAVRYVEMNPVRASLCRDPAEWKWSSYNAHIAGEDDLLVKADAMTKRIVNWRKFMAIDNSDEKLGALRAHSISGQPMGNPAFLAFADKLSKERRSRAPK